MENALTGHVDLRVSRRATQRSEVAEPATVAEPLLPRINSPADIKPLSLQQLRQLAAELREYIISVVSQTGGHLGPSLGVIELTLALHRVYDSPIDKIRPIPIKSSRGDATGSRHSGSIRV